MTKKKVSMKREHVVLVEKRTDIKKNTKEACSDFPEKPLHAHVFLSESADILHLFATLVSVFLVIAIGVNKGSGCVRMVSITQLFFHSRFLSNEFRERDG